MILNQFLLKLIRKEVRNSNQLGTAYILRNTNITMSLFIIGSGARVGAGIARKFQSQGYKVALGSRSPNVEKLVSQGFLPITVDASSVQSIEAAFAEVSEKFGGAPSVVVYNGKTPTPTH